MKKALLAVALMLTAGPVLSAGWVPASTANTPTTALPPAPGTTPEIAAQSAQTATGNSTPPAATPAPGNDITAPLRESAPPAPPTSAEAYAIGRVAPLSRQEVESVKGAIDEEKRGRAWQPVDTVPRISTQTVSLSPGASLPLVRTAVDQPSSIVFMDSTGAPWPLGGPPFNGNNNGFFVQYIPDSGIVSVQALRQYDRGNITVYLKGLNVPVMVNLSSGEPDSGGNAQVIDSRLDLRIPQRGPNAKALPAGENKIGLYSDLLQAFLDGIPPKEAKRLKVKGVPDTEVWEIGDDLYIRTRAELRDSFEQTLSAGDGTTLYKLPVTPEAAFSVAGKTSYLTIELE
ncbi:conjugal transfer protein TraN [Salmonella enterica subsp. enterica]|nr:conjugal transfer protein TraN [Salmonella enterica subsp. enterica serovar Mikawasima]